jgi:hypothetical protein
MVEQTQSTGVETSGWVTENGVVLNPISTPEYTNTAGVSDNGFYRTTMNGKKFSLHYNGSKLRIHGQIHTHPKSDAGPWYWTKHKQFVSGGDHNLAKRYPGLSIYSIGPKNVHMGMYKGALNRPSIIGSTRGLLSGKYSLIP